MNTFCTVNDTALIHWIRTASNRIAYISPGVHKPVAESIAKRFTEVKGIDVTVILDHDENVCRIGYGDLEGLELLYKLAEQDGFTLRTEPGLRVGILLVDDNAIIWSPTPCAVEVPPDSSSYHSTNAANGLCLGMNPSKQVTDALIGAGTSSDNMAEIGKTVLTDEHVEETKAALKDNPPTPFNLSRKMRVLLTKLQFVEVEMRGAEWTKREIKLSNFLLNPDVSEELQDLFETRIKPFSDKADVAIEVPALVQGQVAYNQSGQAITVPMTQADIEKAWKDLRKRYLFHLPWFGWLIRKGDKSQFLEDVAAFETVLKRWVNGFEKILEGQERDIETNIANIIKKRAELTDAKSRLTDEEINDMVHQGIQKRKRANNQPHIKTVFKEITWESTGDEEFTEALSKALPAKELEGWFQVLTAAKEGSNEKARKASQQGRPVQ